MNFVCDRLRFFAFFFVLILLPGCDSSHVYEAKCDEANDKNFVIATQNMRSGQYDDAIKCLLIVIKSRDSAPESSLLLGTIYLDKKNDPVSAIYFLRKYIAECGGKKHVKVAEQLIDTAKKEFLKTCPAYNGVSQEESEIIEVLRSLKEQNVALINQISVYKQRISDYELAIKNLKDEAVKNVSVKGQKTNTNFAGTVHVVGEGETLSSISFKYYGTQNAWSKIFEANRSVLSTPKSLKIGQKLLIP